jgi:hypothetical protein
MSQYQRVIGVSDGRITGTFHVIGLDRDRETWVTAHDVVIYDEGHRFGRVFYSDDLKGSVKDGIAELSKHMITSDKLADVEEVWDDMLAVLVAVVEVFWATAPEEADQHA